MIARIEGILIEKTPTAVVVDVGGVGHELLVSLVTFEGLPDQGKTVILRVRTVVREDAFLLYGFGDAFERSAFDLLIRANRVGPKLAQAILSGLSAETLLRALRDGDAKALRGAPGVGPKMAERMVVELRDGARDLLSQSEGSAAVAGPKGAESGSVDNTQEQLVSALVHLGYPRNQALRVADEAAEEAGEGASIEGLIRVALRRLAP
ncbi:MAG: Holliday junction branch migration protein RuvA [bacterium TMED88]|nr:Holliday junction branch migration protein RuvA [Deltaproteobacteria bacterium]OUV21624.1 MAG: Holliday junction branch migration protein RuvA [bacterium TMED88]